MEPIEIILQKHPELEIDIIKVLYLPLIKDWFDLINKGIKLEEYRDITPYWIHRLVKFRDKNHNDPTFILDVYRQSTKMGIPVKFPSTLTHVCFSLGYTKTRMLFAIDHIRCGVGNKFWGAPSCEVFIIALNERLY